MSLLKKVGAVLGALVASMTIGAGTAQARTNLGEPVKVARARGHFVHTRPKEMILTATGYVPAYRDDAGTLVAGQRWIDTPAGPQLDPRDHVVLWSDDSLNVKTTAGIDFTFAQTYSTSTAANGLNYIALSNDSLTETSASTTLSSEIAANGLSRAQGTYAHTNGQSTSTVTKTFTCATASQACQKAALFTAASNGTMHHVLSFTQRTLQVGDSIAVTFTITIS